MKALVLGATGLIGQYLVEQLQVDEGFTEVGVITRKPVSIANPKLTVHELADFSELSQHPEWFAVDVVFSCLGTTMAKAKSKDVFRTVDYSYNMAAAKAAAAAKAPHFVLVTALGASPKSPFFYSRIKGELEQDVSELPLQRVTFVQPSLLLGERNELRFAEQAVGSIAKVFTPLWRKSHGAWWPIEARNVARAMVTIARSDAVSRVERWQHGDIMAAAKMQ